jgi:hypothetical protein
MALGPDHIQQPGSCAVNGIGSGLRARSPLDTSHARVEPGSNLFSGFYEQPHSRGRPLGVLQVERRFDSESTNVYRISRKYLYARMECRVPADPIRTACGHR